MAVESIRSVTPENISEASNSDPKSVGTAVLSVTMAEFNARCSPAVQGSTEYGIQVDPLPLLLLRPLFVDTVVKRRGLLQVSSRIPNGTTSQGVDKFQL